MNNTKRSAKEHGFVQTTVRRKIHTQRSAAKGPAPGFAQRAAITPPIQGTAADVIRRAMIPCPNAIKGPCRPDAVAGAR